MIDEVRLVLGPRDRLLFYWSGHGDQLIIGNKHHGFLPLARSKRTEFSRMVSMDDISRWDSLLEAQQTLFLLDACLSGLAGLQLKAPNDNRLLQLSQPGHHLITAGTGGENAISGDRWSGSLFTDSFIRGAKGEADHPDTVISLWSLYDYIQRRVAIETATMRWSKSITPQVSFLQSGSGAFFSFRRPPQLLLEV